MSGKFFARASALSLAVLLAACGGDDDSKNLSGVGGGGSSSGGSDTSPETGQDPDTEGGEADQNFDIGSLRLMTSQPQIGTGGKNKATITAVVKSSDSILVPDVDVGFSTVDNLGTLAVSQPKTSDAGIATANLSAAGDSRNRTITVQATAGEQTETIDIPATGTNLSVSGPENLALGDTATFTISLMDSDNRGIAEKTLNIESIGNTVAAGSDMETNSSGNVQVTVTGETSGDSNLSASAFDGDFKIAQEKAFTVSGDSFQLTPLDSTEVPLGTNQNLTLSWSIDGDPADNKEIQFSTTRGEFKDSGKSFVSATTTDGEAEVSISSKDAGKAEITAKSNTGPSTTSIIEFIATKPDSLKLNASRTQIVTAETSDISAKVKDATGNLVKNATVIFTLEDVTGGEISRGSDVTDRHGLARTTYSASNTASEKDGVKITAEVKSATPVNPKDISLTVGGQALSIIIGTGNTINAPDEVFYKQPWGILVTDANGNITPSQDVEISVLPTRYFQGIYKQAPDETWEPDYADKSGCIPENAVPAPGPDDWIQNPASSPSQVTTDDEGKSEFDIRYLKNQCSWAEVKLTATATVDGKESQSSQIFTLPCLAEDMNESSPPGGLDSFYGSGTADDNSLNCKLPK